MGIPILAHYSDVIMSAMSSETTGDWIVCSIFAKAQIKESIKDPKEISFWSGD